MKLRSLAAGRPADASVIGLLTRQKIGSQSRQVTRQDNGDLRGLLPGAASAGDRNFRIPKPPSMLILPAAQKISDGVDR